MFTELTIVHVNVNGIRARRTELQVYLRDTKPDIVCLNETKCHGYPLPTLSGYRLAASRDRISGALRGGGVAIYTSRRIDFKDVSPDIDDMAAITVECNGLTYAVVSHYVPPYTDFKINTNVLTYYIHTYNNVIITGDLNAKHTYFGSRSTNTRGDELFDFTEQHDLLVTNDPAKPTRADLHSADLIDYMIVSRGLVGKVTDCDVGDDIGSDHLPVLLKLRVGGPPTTVPRRLVRPLAKCNWGVFDAALLADCDRLEADIDCTTTAGIDTRVTDFEQSITHALDTACPMVEKKAYSFAVSRETLSLIREKRRIRRLAQRDPYYRTLYHQYTRRVKTAIAGEKAAAWEAATEKLNETNGRAFWQTFKRLTSTSTSGTRACPKLTLASGEKSNDPRLVAEAFGSFLGAVHTTQEGPLFDATHRTTVTNFVETNRHRYTPTIGKHPPPPRLWPTASHG